MTIHFHLPPRRRIKADTRAFKDKRAETTMRLRMELDEYRISRELVDRHNERVRAKAEYRQRGGE